MGRVDARSAFQESGVGAPAAALADKLLPLGDEAGFRPSRDVDTVVFASYASTVADAAVVIRGTFDVQRLTAATQTKSGAPIVRGAYQGQQTFAVGSIAYAVLTSKTIVVGAGDGLRRVLDRFATGTFDVALPPWVVQTLQTQGAEIAVAGDFATQPIASAAMGSVKLPWLQGLRTARIIGNFAKPGMNVAATLGYGIPQQAEAAVQGVRFVDNWLKVLGPLLGGIRLQNLEVNTDQSDLRCKFSLDDASLSSLLALLPRFLPLSSSASTPASPSSSPPSQ